MNRPSTAKEALIAEALGDMAALIDRIKKLGPVMDISHRQLVQISKDLVREVSMFETRMTDFSFKAVDVAAKQIDERTNDDATKILNTQIAAMQSAAREMFNKEFHPVVNRVVSQLEYLTRLAEPNQNPWMPWMPWMHWLTHGAAFVTGAALTWLVVVLVWVK